MKNKRIVFLLVVSITVFLYPVAGFAQTTMEFLTIGNTGNAADPLTDHGAVSYDYRIGKYEVTNSQYTELLNAIATSDPYELYHEACTYGCMPGSYGGILRSGSDGSYTYSVKSGWENKPVNFVEWYDAARFVNWLHNGKTSDPNSTEYGAYDTTGFDNSTTADDVTSHSLDARYWIPTENEWYKAAYYDPTLNSGSGGYYLYPTQSDTAPTKSSPTSDPNSANYDWAVNGVTVVGAYTGSGSYYETYDQGGNLLEMLEDWHDVDPTLRVVRGGSFGNDERDLRSTGRRMARWPGEAIYDIGFRVATVVPEPISSILFVTGGTFLAGRRFIKRKKKA